MPRPRFIAAPNSFGPDLLPPDSVSLIGATPTPTTTSLPAQTTPSYCTDEDILVRAGGDFAALCPPWQQMASGTDGVFSSGDPWTLRSASCDFLANGVHGNHVVWLQSPKSQYPGGGAFLAVDSVATGAVVLRRPHKAFGVGQPPAPAAGISGVTFAIATLDPQSEEASFDIKRRFGIDESIQARTSSWVYDLRDLRIATVLTVLYERYTSENRTDRGDFALKINLVKQQLADVLSRVQVRWGPFGNSNEPSTIFSSKISR